MGTTTPSAFGPLASGTYFLWRHKIASLGIVLLGTLLAELAPWVMQRLQLPSSEFNLILFRAVCGLPLFLYAIPRFLAYLDAVHIKSPENRPEDWKAHFEKRWGRCIAAKLLLYVALSVGLSLYILPGIFMLFYWGWTPLRVLLRGETMQNALLGSVRMARVHTRYILRAGFLLFFVGFGLVVGLSGLAALKGFSSDVHQLFFGALGQLCGLWLDLGFLALFHQTEHTQDPL